METPPGTDLVTHFFADENGELRERIVELEHEKAVLMDSLTESLGQLHRSTVQVRRSCARVVDLVELLRLEHQENSVLRAQLRARQEETAR